MIDLKICFKKQNRTHALFSLHLHICLIFWFWMIEVYKKHYPPMLNDEVWRLEKIGKEGVFHRKLSNHNIKTVQAFLKLYTIDPQKLRTVGNLINTLFFYISHYNFN